MKEPLFVVLEGLDGAGKSTLSGLLAQALSAVELATPLVSLRGVRDVVDEAMADPLARKLWYAAQVAAASRQVELALKEGRSVVMDRYWLSTLAYSAQEGEHSSLMDISKLLRAPDVTLFLRPSLALRRARLLERGALAAHDWIALHTQGDRTLTAAYQSLANHRLAGRFVELLIRPNETPPYAGCKSFARGAAQNRTEPHHTQREGDDMTKRTPTYLRVVVTTKCPMACSFCHMEGDPQGGDSRWGLLQQS